MAIRMEQPARRIRAALRSRLATLSDSEQPWSAFRPFPVYSMSAESLAALAAVADEAYLIGWRYVVAGRSQALLCVDINLLERERVGAGVVAEAGMAEALFEAGRLAERSAGEGEYRARILDLGFVGEEHVWLAAENANDIFVSVSDIMVESGEALVGRAAVKALRSAQPAGFSLMHADDLAGGGPLPRWI